MSLRQTRATRSLANRAAIVTGAGSAADGIGNGRAAAVLLAEAGCAVLCADLDLAAAQRTAELVRADGHGRAVAAQADVSDEAACRRLVELAVAEFGRLDILVNNVGIGGAAGTAVEVDMAAWERGMRVNVGSMVMMAKYAIPEMVRGKEGAQCKGAIVNIGSVAGLRGGTPSLLYPTSKGAVVNMTVIHRCLLKPD
jgi:NAD(P)-dependent dehydrogenase (short-subunit alcohol dehydrogenase family)